MYEMLIYIWETGLGRNTAVFKKVGLKLSNRKYVSVNLSFDKTEYDMIYVNE